MKIKYLIFSYRSFTPIPIVFILLYFTEFRIPFLWIGLGLVFIGEYIRFKAVQYAGGITRTRNVGAPSLCQSGPYSYVRNPLYVGNMYIYIGFVFVAGSHYIWELFCVVFIYFSIQYAMIIALEEKTLSNLFGKVYDQYKNNVPRFIPRSTPWNNSDNRIPASIKITFINEKRTLQNIILFMSLIIIKNI